MEQKSQKEYRKWSYNTIVAHDSLQKKRKRKWITQKYIQVPDNCTSKQWSKKVKKNTENEVIIL